MFGWTSHGTAKRYGNWVVVVLVVVVVVIVVVVVVVVMAVNQLVVIQ